MRFGKSGLLKQAIAGGAVAADYGLTVMVAAPPDAYRLALFILPAPGQAIPARHGFTAPNMPEQRTTP